MNPAAVKQRKLFSGAIAVFLCALLASPVAEATRYLPKGIETLPTTPRQLPSDPDRDATEDFWLFAEN